MLAWETDKWTKFYIDENSEYLIVLLDSHQVDEKGKLSGRYNVLTPCHFMVSTNEHVDETYAKQPKGVVTLTS